MNTRTYLILSILLLFSVESFAQNDSTSYPANRLRLDHFLPGASYEIGIGRKITVVTRSNFNRAHDLTYFPQDDFDYVYNRSAIEFRFYYDPYRIFKPKPHWRRNSGIYHAIFGHYDFNFYRGGSFGRGVGFVHGFQHIYRRFSFNVSGGVRYFQTYFFRDPEFFLYFSGSMSYAF